MRLKLDAAPALLVLLALVAWSPPNNETLVVGSTYMTSSQGRLAVIGTGSEGNAKNALVVGIDHDVNKGYAEMTGSVVAGSTNNVYANNALVSGLNNEVVSATEYVKNSAVIGANNELLSEHGYIMGYNNIVSGNYGFAFGYGLNGANSKSIALGKFNEPMSAGDTLVVGTGTDAENPFTALRVTNDGGVILGRAQGDISMGNYQ